MEGEINLGDNQVNGLITSLKDIRSRGEENSNGFIANIKLQAKSLLFQMKSATKLTMTWRYSFFLSEQI